jgi:ribosomal protein S18 acetylase RimI-like enzyme
MSIPLKKQTFSEANWAEVQNFDCGSEPYELEVSAWLKGQAGEDSALTSIHHPEKPGRVWLYKLPDNTLVGFGALAKSEWRWKGKKDPKIALSIIIWIGLQKEFRGQPPGPKEDRYSTQILDDLIAEALESQETHPVLGLFVHRDNVRAIRLYQRAGFMENLEPTKDGQYLRMAVVLNPEVLRRVLAAANK